jgi:hypothetical protein
MTKVIFVVDFCHLVTESKMGCDLFKGFSEEDFVRKRRPKSPYFGGNKILNLPHLDHVRFLYVASIMWGLGYNLLPL